MNEHELRIKELELENARLKEELDRATKFQEGYQALFVQQEDWTQVEREMVSIIQNAPYSLGDLIQKMEAEGSQDAA